MRLKRQLQGSSPIYCERTMRAKNRRHCTDVRSRHLATKIGEAEPKDYEQALGKGRAVDSATLYRSTECWP
ncbi:hypothetical protein [Pseudomonas sp. PA15(2017)]|uniref:hypothetical protein n=1 Tax=Pseudomonas sp. PA15(2017) TaxID=1932111 RepID=UPI001179AC80|nr:hypothetical protein [Pseudomonas sp. PA15(2017)]